MELRDYFHFKRILVKNFAKSANCTAAYLSLISCGKVRPSKKMAKKISDATNNEVTIDDLMSIKPRLVSVSKRQKDLIEELKAKLEAATKSK